MRPLALGVTFADSWQAFVEAPTTLGPRPGVREAWHRGRVHYALWMLRLEDERVLERKASISQALAGFSTRPIAPADAHVTLSVAGFRGERMPAQDDEVHNWELEVTGRSLTMSPSDRFTITIGGAHSFLTCAALKVSDPDGGLASLRSRTGADLRFGHPYLPHVTVSSYQADIPTSQIAAALEPLRELPPLVVQIEAVELVDYDARLEGAPLKTRARLPLG